MKVPSVIRLISAVCFLAILPVPGHALTPAQVFDKVKDAVVVVKTLDAQGKVKGTGERGDPFFRQGRNQLPRR